MPNVAEPETEKKRRGFPMTARILVAMALGLAAGPLLGKHALELGGLGTAVIQLIKAVATPLLFLAIVRAISTVQVGGKLLGRMVVVSTINVSIAIFWGLLLSNVFEPGSHLEFTRTGDLKEYEDKQFDWVKTLQNFVPKDLVSPFLENAVLSVVVLALLFGFALRHVATSPDARGHEEVARLVDGLYRIAELVLSWVLQLIPFAVFGVVAKTTSQYGMAPLRGLAAYLAIGIGGLTLHVLVTYQLWLRFVARMPLGRFWREAKRPVIVAFGSNSSLATLPVTLRALDRLGVSRQASAVGACVGTNLNNDGIVLYEGMAVLLVAQAMGMSLPLGQQVLVSLFCILAAMGVAGIPEAGFISLALVLNATSLPLDLLPLLLTVDWVIARGCSVVNVLSDMVLSIVLDIGERARGGSSPPLPDAETALTSSSPRAVVDEP